MKSEGLSCGVCHGSIAIDALDRERGWVTCGFCENVRRIGVPLPVEFEQSPERRMLWVHKGDRSHIVIRPPGGPRWLYPAMVWLGVIAFVSLFISGVAMNLMGLGLLTAGIAYLVWRRTEAQFTIDSQRIDYARYLGDHRLWGWHMAVPEGARVELGGTAFPPSLRIRGGDEHQFLTRLRSHDERRWLAKVIEQSIVPDETVATTECTNCGADLEITTRTQDKGAINCDFCGIGLVFAEAGVRAVAIGLGSTIDLNDPADLYPDDVGIESRGRTSKGTEWLVEHPRIQGITGLGFLVGALFAAHLAITALSHTGSSATSFHGYAWGALFTLVVIGAFWAVAAPDYGPLHVLVTDRKLVLDKRWWGVPVYRYELPLVSLWSVDVDFDGDARVAELTVRTCFRRVEVHWNLDNIDTPKLARELFAELNQRLEKLDRVIIDQKLRASHRTRIRPR